MKSLFKSKTFWANVVSLLAMAATASGNPLFLIFESPDVQQMAVAGITGALNIGLRVITKDAVSIIGGK